MGGEMWIKRGHGGVHAATASCLFAIACVAPLFVVGCRASADGEHTPIRVAAAADLMLAFEDMKLAFEQQTSSTVVFSFGSTGLLAKQIGEGAPFDVFAAANHAFVDDVVRRGVCDGATKAPYARGRIAVFTKRGTVEPPRDLRDLVDERFTRVAIAHPEHAPYGQAAKQAFEALGLWETMSTRLVYGENVRHTLQFAETGNVEAAIVALSLVVSDRENAWTLVDDALHRPIDQVLVVCTGGMQRAGGDAFARFVNAPEGRAIMKRYGFLLPGEEHAHAP